MSSTPPQAADKNGLVDRLKVWRAGIRRRRPVNLVYRTVVTIVGFLVIAIGLLLLPLPGPGWLIVFLGLGILSTEYDQARRLLDFARDKVRAWSQWLGRQPLLVRALVGLVLLAFVLFVVGVMLWWYGVPSWVPDGMPLVHDLPQRS